MLLIPLLPTRLVLRYIDAGPALRDLVGWGRCVESVWISAVQIVRVFEWNFHQVKIRIQSFRICRVRLIALSLGHIKFYFLDCVRFVDLVLN